MKKRMILALVLVFALLCLACSNDADDGASSSESVSVAETDTESSAESSSRTESTSSADETSGETSTVESASSDTSSGTSGTVSSTSSDTSTDSSTSSNPSESRDTNSETSSDTSTPSKPAENSESSTPAESSKPAENSDTSSSSGNPNPSQTGHKHSYKTTVVKPTCTEDGYTLHECSCGDSYTDNEVPAMGHNLLGIQTIKSPTATERGKQARVCIHNCGYSETEELYSWNEVAKIEQERLLYWINKYRAEEGAPALIVSKKLTELDEYRAQQALQGGEHAGHNLDDEAKACEAVKVGCFCDYVYHASDGTVVQPHWDPHDSAGQEAWSSLGLPTFAIKVGDTESIDSIAKRLATGFRASAGHWAYVGGKGTSYKDYVYVGFGVSAGNCYITVCDYNPDEKGYKHITLDEDGNEHIEWVKD